MKCSDQIIELIHEFLDEEIELENEQLLRKHLQQCKDCETLFQELNKTIAFVKSTASMQAPPDFTANVLAKLPKEKKRIGIERWLKSHPLVAAASLFIILMLGSLVSNWSQDRDFSVTKQKNLIVKNNTVIVPKGKVVEGDVIVQNGKIKIEGEVKGNVTVINGEKYMASAGHVTGKVFVVNKVFDWIWYYMKKTANDCLNVFDQIGEK